MAVYVDNFYTTGAGQYGRMQMSHLIADTTAELMQMAKQLNISSKWVQKPGERQEHFDVCKAKRAKAISLGAVAITWRSMGAITGNRVSNNDPVDRGLVVVLMGEAGNLVKAAGISVKLTFIAHSKATRQ